MLKFYQHAFDENINIHATLDTSEDKHRLKAVFFNNTSEWNKTLLIANNVDFGRIKYVANAKQKLISLLYSNSTGMRMFHDETINSNFRGEISDVTYSTAPESFVSGTANHHDVMTTVDGKVWQNPCLEGANKEPIENQDYTILKADGTVCNDCTVQFDEPS